MEIKDCIADEQLNIYLDGELTQEEHTLVEAHLGRCSRCRTRLDGINLPGAWLRAESLRAVDAADFSQVWERVRAEAFPAEPAIEPRRSWLDEVPAGVSNIFSPALTAVAIALLVVVVYFTAGLTPPQPAPPSIMEAVASNEAQIISLETDSPAIMVLQSPDSGATIIFISDNSTETGEEPTI